MNAPTPPSAFAIPTPVEAAPTRAKKAKVWARADLEWYVEPERVTTQLLAVERFPGVTWDPCCGGGNVLRALVAAGMVCLGTDLVRRPQLAGGDALTNVSDLFAAEHDFRAGSMGWTPFTFLGAWPGAALNLVFNPPFYRAQGTEAFIRRALSVATGKVAAFVDLRFLAGDGRARGLFASHPPTRIWIITPRPSCPPGTYLAEGHEAGNGASDWCWLVWDLTAPQHGTTTDWLRWRSVRAAAEAAA